MLETMRGPLVTKTLGVHLGCSRMVEDVGGPWEVLSHIHFHPGFHDAACSIAENQELVHTVIEGLINWRQVYMVRSSIFPWFSFAL